MVAFIDLKTHFPPLFSLVITLVNHALYKSVIHFQKLLLKKTLWTLIIPLLVDSVFPWETKITSRCSIINRESEMECVEHYMERLLLKSMLYCIQKCERYFIKPLNDATHTLSTNHAYSYEKFPCYDNYFQSW